LILVDTSAWVEYLRATGSDVDRHLDSLLRSDERLAVTEVAVMEVLAGARDDRHSGKLSALLARCDLLALSGVGDYERAAELFRHCRRAGETPRALLDCLVAVVAMREGVPLLQLDSDFEAIARHAALELADAGPPTGDTVRT
jgi:predicted nucleic acid-binding protein